MRKIKFRGKNANDEWVYGSLVQELYGDVWIFPEGDTYCNAGGDFYSNKYPGICMVKPETVGQFTGLHDKDGRDIYDGDLVEMMRTPEKMRKLVITRHIVTSDSVTSWTFRSLTKQVLGFRMSGMGEFDSYRFKVVGNIHDNPEMVQQVSLTIPERKPLHHQRQGYLRHWCDEHEGEVMVRQRSKGSSDFISQDGYVYLISDLDFTKVEQ